MMQMTPFEALYERKCWTPMFWEQVGTQQLMGLKLVKVTNSSVQKIKQKMLTAQSQQKSYAKSCKKDLKFVVGDHIFSNVAMGAEVWKEEQVKFEVHRSLRDPRVDRTCGVQVTAATHPRYYAQCVHVFMLRKYILDPTHVIEHEAIPLRENLYYEEIPDSIIARDVKQLQNKEILNL